MITGKEEMEVNRKTSSQNAVPEVPRGRETKELLIVRNKGNSHLLGRFFQAMILNFLKKPDKLRTIKEMDLIVAFDPMGHSGNTLTLHFTSGHVVLECGIKAKPDITIMGEPSILMMLSRMPAGLLPVIGYFRTYEGKDLIARFWSGELKIKGILKHPLGMMQFAKVMAPNIY